MPRNARVRRTAQVVHAKMPKQSAAASAKEQRDKSILYDIAIDELGKLKAPAIKRAMQFMGIKEVYPNKKSRMCAFGARRLAIRSSTASAARSRL